MRLFLFHTNTLNDTREATEMRGVTDKLFPVSVSQGIHSCLTLLGVEEISSSTQYLSSLLALMLLPSKH